MKSLIPFLFAICLISSVNPVFSSGLPHIFAASDVSSTQVADQTASRSLIKDIQVFGKNSGIAYVSYAIYRTDDGGENWTELTLPRPSSALITSVWFSSEIAGTALVVDFASVQLLRYDTRDGGNTWTSVPMDDDSGYLQADLTNSDLDSARTWITEAGKEVLQLRLATSSNFRQFVQYTKKPGEALWSRRVSFSEDPQYGERFENLKDFWEIAAKAFPDTYKVSDLPEDPVIARDVTDMHADYKVNSDWYLTQNGSCTGIKKGCVLTTRIYKDVSTDEDGPTHRIHHISFREITPPNITALNNAEKEAARSEVENSPLFLLPPAGGTRTSLNRGFDKCQAGSVAQMQLWWDNSYFFDSNIYFSGRNRACPSQPFTNNPTWINQVSAMGWGFIPTVVGYQSPCTASTTTAKFSYDPVISEQQGRGEADIAVSDAASIGLTAGSILYYDMERYDPPSPDTLGCRAATITFLKGWTDRIKELGYKSGTYGSPKNAEEDWVTLPPASQMDAIWMARWDNVPSVWTYVSFPSFPTNVWNDHQRIKQWQAPHNETWAGVTFNIDGNIADGPVAGINIPKNKNADFDGDGKTDISVFRPDTGQWFVQGTLGPTYSVYQFGEGQDVLTPGDWDGDGKTDLAVFRPSNGTWYFLTKGSFTTRQFGEAGDIPAAADYNGDGKADIALFRPSNGTWYFSFSDSLNTFATVQFGVSGDKPAVADYDGDGRPDTAVWRSSDATWYILGSTAGYYNVQWGASGDQPVPGDYDGDGKADIAVFRAGTWLLHQTIYGDSTQQFGVAGDIPATGDYDGDGHDDLAVFRPSDNTWYIRTSNSYRVIPFGNSTDRPVPSSYLPQ